LNNVHSAIKVEVPKKVPKGVNVCFWEFFLVEKSPCRYTIPSKGLNYVKEYLCQKLAIKNEVGGPHILLNTLL
jgi:hypothetical protein